MPYGTKKSTTRYAHDAVLAVKKRTIEAILIVEEQEAIHSLQIATTNNTKQQSSKIIILKKGGTYGRDDVSRGLTSIIDRANNKNKYNRNARVSSSLIE